MDGGGHWATRNYVTTTFIGPLTNTPDGKHTCFSFDESCSQAQSANVRLVHLLHTHSLQCCQFSLLWNCVSNLFKQKPGSVALMREFKPTDADPLQQSLSLLTHSEQLGISWSKNLSKSGTFSRLKGWRWISCNIKH